MSDVRAYLAGLLEAWVSGTKRPQDVFRDARMSWLSGAWPKSFQQGYDPVGMEVLFMLASARDMALTEADIPELRAYLSARDLGKAQDRFFAYWESSGGSAAREAVSRSDDYYGPTPMDGVDDAEFTFSDPGDRRLHRLVREDPETAWPELRDRLCSPGPRDEALLDDLVEDLMFNDPDRFIDRIEAVVEECPNARDPIARAHIGGRASSPGLERFWALQERLGNWR
jgi:hypothetical protein